MPTYYKGLAFPFQAGETAIPAPVTDAELVRQSLLQLVQTPRGERVMRPNYGCNVQQFVFESNNEALGQLLRTEISAAITRWEPRARVDNISISRTDSALAITILYTVVTTQTQSTLQFSVPVPKP